MPPQGEETDDARVPELGVTLVVQQAQYWQYYQETGCSTERLNTLGRAGWHLVGPPTPSAITAGTSGRLLYIFERPLPVPPIVDGRSP